MRQEQNTLHCYNSTAAAYARDFINELDGKPLDRLLLQQFAQTHLDKGLVGDLGCGPGQTTFFLHQAGLRQLLGIDLSPRMIEQAKQLSEGRAHFACANMLQLPYPDEHFGGLIAFYAIVHLDLNELPQLFAEIKRVLRSAGQFFFSFHVGEGVVSLDEFLGQSVQINFNYFDPDAVLTIANATGFKTVEALIRYPYEGLEYPSKRAYIKLTH
ncbi:MAG: class I SAM-dependent methyltransferase [Bacteroidota bacterium]